MQFNTFDFNKNFCIFGGGGHAREVFYTLRDRLLGHSVNFSEWVQFVVPEGESIKSPVAGHKVLFQSQFNQQNSQAVVAVGCPIIRKKIVDSLPAQTLYATVTHPTATLLSDVCLGVGSVVLPQTILTCQITLGAHSHINIGASLSHDVTAGDYFTASPGVHVSGNCHFGDQVFLGTGCSLKPNLKISSHVTVGTGAVVVNDILLAGVYVGNPAKLLVEA